MPGMVNSSPAATCTSAGSPPTSVRIRDVSCEPSRVNERTSEDHGIREVKSSIASATSSPGNLGTRTGWPRKSDGASGLSADVSQVHTGRVKPA